MSTPNLPMMYLNALIFLGCMLFLSLHFFGFHHWLPQLVTFSCIPIAVGVSWYYVRKLKSTGSARFNQEMSTPNLPMMYLSAFIFWGCMVFLSLHFFGFHHWLPPLVASSCLPIAVGVSWYYVKQLKRKKQATDG